MNIAEHISIKAYNTFGIDAKAKYFGEFSSIGELSMLLDFRRDRSAEEWMILGGGSNILFTKDVNGLVAKNNIRGITVIKEDEQHVYVKAGAGEEWHGFVQYCINAGLAGVENLSLIPGNVGASPMQNIGAYGVEIKDVFHSLEAFHLGEKKMYTFSLADCEFGYRESVFKRKYKGEFAICSVVYRLNKQPEFHTSYGALQQELQTMGVEELSIRAVSEAVIRIRTSKLPDPKETGNAGSFFKNPEISREQYLSLKAEYPAIPGYELDNGNVKIPAGWLIEHSGPQAGTSWKGYRIADAGCHNKQALVLVNYGNASGNEIYELSCRILESVEQKFSVVLEREVNII